MGKQSRHPKFFGNGDKRTANGSREAHMIRFHSQKRERTDQILIRIEGNQMGRSRPTPSAMHISLKDSYIV